MCTSMTMDGGRPSPPTDLDESSNGSSPLLHDRDPPRPYQAYCATEASSRAPSPDTLTPRPLRIGKYVPLIRDNESRHLPRRSLAPSILAAIEQDRRDVEVVPTLGNERDEGDGHTNGSASYRSTMLIKSNHITQAVTPRESLPLMDNQPMMYDRTPSQVRMQQSTPEYVATTSTCRRKPVPQHVVVTSMVHRPLPPIPLEIAPVMATHDVQREPHNAKFEEVDYELPWRPSLAYFGIEKLGDRPCSQSQVASQTCLKADATREHEAESTRLNESRANAHRPLHTMTSHQSWTPRSYTTSLPAYPDFGGHAQLPSSLELYEPRGLLSKMEDDGRAYRRTQPKDAKFKYQFGRRPSIRLDRPPLPPSYLSLPNSSVDLSSPTALNTQQADEDLRRQSPAPSSRSYTEAQAGPRPPPWGSSDNLEVRRQTRSEIREREEARRFRMTIDSGSSIYKGSDSTDRLRQNTMRREVKEYREQVLQLYPDMEFDGNASKGGRTCLCVVM